SFSRDPASLQELAAEIGGNASRATPAEAAAVADGGGVSLPWGTLGGAPAQAGSPGGQSRVGTPHPGRAAPAAAEGGTAGAAEGETAAQFNAARMPGARYTKSFNTLTSAFQAEAAGREGDSQVVQWLCGEDEDAKQVVAGLIKDAGFVPVDLGGTATCAVME